jgi:spermidine/putrescine transport system substrate-binding protein
MTGKHDSLVLTLIFRFTAIVVYVFFVLLILHIPKLPKFKEHGVIRIYSFSDSISPESIQLFEKKFGIKVILKYFDTNEELFSKFLIGGGEGYDLITPSDYMVEVLINNDLLHKLDHSKLDIMNDLDPRLRNKFFDPKNNYSIPFSWVTYGIVFNKNVFKKIPEKIGLDFLFNPTFAMQFNEKGRCAYKVGMIDDYREAALLAGIYLFGDAIDFDSNQLQKIQNLLISQKKWVEFYESQDMRYFLLAGIVDVAIASSSWMGRMRQIVDNFDFKIPHEGSLMVIENLAIPSSCKNVDLVHKFINFILSEDISVLNSFIFGFNASNKKAYKHLDEDILKNRNVFPDDEIFSKLHLMHNNMPVKKFEEIWLKVKGF